MIDEIESAIRNEKNPVTLRNRDVPSQTDRPYAFFKKFKTKEEAHACSDKIRILLVVAFTNIGSSLGTFVAIPLMVKVL